MKKDSLAVVSATFATSYMEARYFFTFKFLQLLSFQSYCLDALKNERLSSWHFEIIMIVFDIHLNSFWVVLGIWTWCITVVTITMKCPLSSGHKFCKGNKTESRLRIWIFLCLCKENCKLVFSALSLFFFFFFTQFESGSSEHKVGTFMNVTLWLPSLCHQWETSLSITKDTYD